MNNITEFFISLTVIIFATWLFFPDFDGKDTIKSYSIYKPIDCKTKKECRIKTFEPHTYTINKYNKEVYQHIPDIFNLIRTYGNCSIISVEDWECQKYDDIIDHRKLKMADSIIIEVILMPYTMIVNYVPKWKWKLVKYFGYQPKLKPWEKYPIGENYNSRQAN